jgi:endonuclease YncB( thermonuclease family)
MLRFFTIALLALLPALASAESLVMPIVSVVDGDTIRSSMPLPCPLCNVSIRILGIDTPESNYTAKCPEEVAQGIEAKEFLKSFVGDETTMVISNYKWDKYGGRIDADVSVKGTDIARLMIRNGYAVPYTGSGPKEDWCN